MKEIQIQKIAIGLVCVFIINFVGCGGTSVRTIQGPKDISNYNKIYVADPDVSSVEQEEKHIASNAEYTQFARDTIINTLKEKGTFSLIESLSSSPGSLSVETKIDLRYGNRAMRYMVGFGAGSGSIVCNLKLKDISSGEIKLEMESNSTLAIGAFGGSMGAVIEANIKKTVREFAKKL
jgi:hypothetical protein